MTTPRDDLREQLEAEAIALSVRRFTDMDDTGADALAALLRKAAARLGEREWRDIAEAPKDEKDILVTFRGQWKWVTFVARAFGAQTNSAGYAPPTHFMPLPSPPETTNDR